MRCRRVIQPARDAEVRNQGVAVLGEQNVFGLHVAVHHPVLVGVLQRLAGFPRNPEGIVQPQRPLPAEAVAKAFALDVGHGKPEMAATLARVEDGEHMGMLQSRGQPYFLKETVRAQAGGEMRMEDLERDRPVVLEVAREVDDGHAAVSELALENISLQQGVGELGWNGGHPLNLAGERSSNHIHRVCSFQNDGLERPPDVHSAHNHLP